MRQASRLVPLTLVVLAPASVAGAQQSQSPTTQSPTTQSPATRPPTAQSPQVPALVQLFNGKDLSNWHTDIPAADDGSELPASFVIEDGLLVSVGKPLGHLITNSSHSNYRLTVEWRWPGKPGNCGVLVHSSVPRRLYKMFPQSIECQLHHGNAGDFWCIGEDIKVPDMVARRGPDGPKAKWGGDEGDRRRIKNLTDGSERPLGEWNEMVIECHGREIEIWVNGDFVNNGFDCTANSGQIALQAEGARCEFRKVELEPIKTKFVSLFDGDTLQGWTQKNGTATYRVEGGAIVGKTAEGSPNSFLCTARDYGDFELRFEVKVDNPLNSGVQIRSREKPGNGRVNGPQVEIEASGKNGAEAGYLYAEAAGGWMTPKDVRQPHKHFKDGEWNAYRVIAKGARIQVWVNGTQVSDLTHDKMFASHPQGFIGLQVHGIGKGRGPFEVRWRNLRLREL